MDKPLVRIQTLLFYKNQQFVKIQTLMMLPFYVSINAKWVHYSEGA